MEALDLAIILLSGLVGATIFGFLRPDREDTKRALLSTGFGAVVSVICTPAACLYWKIPDIEYKIIVAFGIGLVGMTLCKIVVVSVQTEAHGVGPWFVKMLKKLFGVQG